MYKRVDEQRPIRMRDPLFRELFRHARKIEMRVEKTEKGVRVIETAKDAYVARLIQAHAKVVSGFVKDGFGEARKQHAVPAANAVLK
jgi:predicted nuclease with RNAse H fold